MHDNAAGYVELVTARLAPKAVLELGSRDVNGSPRVLFPNVKYTGVDLEPGPSVDVVADAANWTPDLEYDLVLCCEVMEHTPRWRKILSTAFWSLRPGGWLVVTAATAPRAPHSAVDGGPLRADEYYRNVDPEELETALLVRGFAPVSVTTLFVGDVYAVGRRAATECESGR